VHLRRSLITILELGSKRELFVDYYLVEKLAGRL